MLRPVSNPPNPWHTTEVEWIGEPPADELKVYETRAKAILAKNESPDVGFRWSLNPYRGCQHACAYCYARPSHQYLDFGAGTDFDRKIVVRMNAPEALRAHFEKKSWSGEIIAFSGNTDCYQPLEAHYRLTRRCLEACLEYRNPVGIITKSALIRRDLDVIGELAALGLASAAVSIPFHDPETCRKVEPGAPSPATRLETIRALADAGVRVTLAMAPIIPGLNDSDMAPLLEKAAAAGATRAFCLPVRLASEVLPVFSERMQAAFPDRWKKIENAILEMRDGKMNDPRFGHRQTGSSNRWKATE
ncbi:MAG: radical SAM protein, partial [Chrysiogenetes bacterium]|nr:radical SAM protein [Chrysiogenetes bacterium]